MDGQYGGRDSSHGNDFYRGVDGVVKISGNSGKRAKPAKARPTNWSKEDDQVLVGAWLKYTNDPINGTGQTAEKFWGKITDEVNHYRPGCTRSLDACKTHWQKIQKSVSKYIGCEIKANDHCQGVRSGGSPDDVKELAMKLFTDLPNDLGEFNFFHVLDVLRDVPKFFPLSSNFFEKKNSTSVGSDGEDYSPRVSTMDLSSDDGTPTFPKRPPGTKQAKMKATGKSKGKGKSTGSNCSGTPVMSWTSMLGDASKYCDDMVAIEKAKLDFDRSQRDAIKDHQQHEIAQVERRTRSYRHKILVELLKKNDLTPEEKQMKDNLIIELM